jgi:glycosyltransferase involved in cell wall biosynthesis
MSLRVLLYAGDPVGGNLAGPGIRYRAFARELGRRFDVVLAEPFGGGDPIEGVEVVHVPAGDRHALARLARSCDAVVAQRLPLPVVLAARRCGARIVHDLYAPTLMEKVAAAARSGDSPEQRGMRRTAASALRLAARSGDAFICASERQRDFWLGVLLAEGRIDAGTFAADPSLRALVEVVPFGIDDDPPEAADGPVLKGVVPGIGANDRVLLWPGGVWDWLDPETPIRAVAELSRRRDDLRLYFLGLRSPNEGRAHGIVERARALADELGATGRSVFFNDGWVPYRERAAYLLEADAAVSAHHDDVEARLAYRSRLLDCIWARLPVVATGGDELGDLVEERGMGIAVPAGDVGAWVAAIDAILEEARAERCRRAMAEVAPELTWARAVAPLVRLLEGGGPERRRGALLPALGYAAARARQRMVPPRRG